MSIKEKSHSSGFTMLEFSIVLLVVGILAAGAIVLITPLVEQARQLETTEKLNKIGDALNVYVLNNLRLPCPAQPRRTPTGGEPFGYEQGSGATGAGIPQACPALAAGGIEGIVPFRTIGIPEALIRDAWGHYITYGVSDAFARDTAGARSAGATPEPGLIHPQCRTRDWMYATGYDASGNEVFRNRASQKARFCCPGALSSGALRADITVNDEDGASVLLPDAGGTQRNSGPDGYQTVDTLMNPANSSTLNNNTCAGTVMQFGFPGYFLEAQVPPACARATAIAYVLVSHGPDGRGVYSINNGARINVPVAANLQDENFDGDGIFRDQFLRQNVNGANGIDDLVLWRTQDLIFASQKESCSLP